MRIKRIALLAIASSVLIASSAPSQETCGGIAGIPCEPGQFCRLPDGRCCCDHQGVCTDFPEVCAEVWDPVCGCDGQTYSSRCHASMQGVSVGWVGACDDLPAVTLTGFTAAGLLSWLPVPGALAYNIYLEQVEGPPSAFDGTCLYAAVPENAALLRGAPHSGQRWLLQVSVLDRAEEGPLGWASGGIPRLPQAPCTCTLPADVGPCDGVFPRWYHDYTIGQCAEFEWGGCEGNANNFETQADCETACMDPCRQPAIHGDCEAAILRWYHNVLTGRCELFVWGGCGAGANNFETREVCQAVCGDICLLPPDVGDCDGICERWYFDPATDQCETFVWGCCGGNANNFPTQGACEAACVDETFPQP